MVNQVEIHRKSRSNIEDKRGDAVTQLRINFAEFPSKDQAWADLLHLSQDENNDVRLEATRSLSLVFSRDHDKDRAWTDMIRLIQDDYSYAFCVIDSAFPYVPNKKKAWLDIHRLTFKWLIASDVVYVIISIFRFIPDKEQAWNDLIALANDEGAFDDVDEEGKVRQRTVWAALYALGSAFPHVPNKEKALDDIYRLSQDKESQVRIHANYSLCRAYIFKATETESEDNFRKELENALKAFERSSEDSYSNTTAKFCFPFYRSFYTLTFNKQESEAEVQRYLAEAKSATEGSANKEKLLEAIENLANALKEVHDARKTDFDIMKRDLNAYRRYCDRAADLLDTTEEKAPGATKLIRKGLPIFNQRIKELLDGIAKETKILCDAASGIEAEEFVKPTCKEVKELIKIRNPIELDKRIAGLIPNLRFMVENLPEQERNFGYNKIEILNKEDYLEDKLSLINEIIVFVAPHISMSKDLGRLENKLDDIMISLEPGVREELSVTVGAKVFGYRYRAQNHYTFTGNRLF